MKSGAIHAAVFPAEDAMVAMRPTTMTRTSLTLWRWSPERTTTSTRVVMEGGTTIASVKNNEVEEEEGASSMDDVKDDVSVVWENYYRPTHCKRIIIASLKQTGGDTLSPPVPFRSNSDSSRHHS